MKAQRVFWLPCILIAPIVSQTLPSSYPHVYSGQPSGDFSPEWQDYFQVTNPLPNVSFPLSRSFAGNIPVQREGHPNDTLFFWGFESKNGSLTAAANESSDPWGIWLTGGPGTSSMAGVLFESGPIRIGSDYGASLNNYSWNTLADFFWIDQPVGTGWATADADGYVADEDQLGLDFMGFLENLVKVFPSLGTRPLYITGESYAGAYIPYILKTYFSMANPPVEIAKIAIGDGTITSVDIHHNLPTVTVLETWPQIIGYDPEVFEYFREQSHLCGFDVNLTYPQNGIIPSITLPSVPILESSDSEEDGFNRKQARSFRANIAKRIADRFRREDLEIEINKRDRDGLRTAWKRDLTGRANGTIDTWYGCFLMDEFTDYAVNFTFPWNLSLISGPSFDVYNVPDALSPEAPIDASVWLNDNHTRSAIHAPTSKDWEMGFDFPFGIFGTNDPSAPPMEFLSELASNASARGIPIVLYSGNDDSLDSHRGTEVVIQNTTFGGIQGFTRKPSTPWFDDSGNFAGIIHQERNWTYALFQGAAHQVPMNQPENALIFFRDFILGNKTTGLVYTDSNGVVQVVGGENSTLAADALPGPDDIFYGSGMTQSTYVFPSATRAAWTSFIHTATAIAGAPIGS